MAILAALAHLDPDQHALGVDVADAQHHHLAAAQAGAIGNAQRRLVFEPRAGRGLDQPGNFIGREDARQLSRIVRSANWWVRSGRPSVMVKKNRSPEAWLFSFEGCAPCST